MQYGTFFWIITGYLIIMNLIGFILAYVDKQKAIRKTWRIPEKTLFFVAAAGGSIGFYLGMQVFRHKTKHLSFTIGIPLIILLQIAAGYFIIKSL